MTLMVFLAGIAAAIASVAGYVTWRDRRGGGSIVDPSVSRDALVQADRQAVQARLAYAEMPVTDFLPLGRDFSQANRSGPPSA